MPESPELGKLIELLQQAAELEHCLLNTYLYAACSLKTTPQEFAVANGQQNRRRAIQFERTRAWKQTLLQVAVGEMLHLHNVQCLLRGLNQPAYFGHPPRVHGAWLIRAWDDPALPGSTQGVSIPLSRLTREVVTRFVAFEASDSLQDIDPAGPVCAALFDRLYQFELQLEVESMLYGTEDESLRATLQQKFITLLTNLPTVAPQARPTPLPAATLAAAVDTDRFQSVGDLYRDRILPLYEKAWNAGLVERTNEVLLSELDDPPFGAPNFVPGSPAVSSRHVGQFLQQSAFQPLRNFSDVENLVEQIVTQGEGLQRFQQRSLDLLDIVEKPGGSRKYLEALKAQAGGATGNAPDWLAAGELLRQSHVYRFAIMLAGLRQEHELSKESGGFDPRRDHLALSSDLAQLVKELPAQFNACYLVLLAWLSRVYEIGPTADRNRREVIEMIASWPLMSLAIRPMLELAAFLPIDPGQLFRIDAKGLPGSTSEAQLLRQVYAKPRRTESSEEQIDALVLKVLSATAAWAAQWKTAIARQPPAGLGGKMVLRRLDALAKLGEFEKQFPFRVHGGFCNCLPDSDFQQSQPNATRFEEDPTMRDANGDTRCPLYQDTLVLRLRFSGWSRIQMASDYDPPSEETGCTGILKLHAADGDRTFDGAAVWQDFDNSQSIVRGPRAKLPPIGVNCVDISLLVANGPATAGYVPLPTPQPPCVSKTLVPQELEVNGLSEVLTLPAAAILNGAQQIRLNLQEKDGVKPRFVGLNHLVWRDGEPMDPFVLAVFADPATAGAAPDLLFQREVYNEGLSLLDMSPLQRIWSARWPCGNDRNLTHIPEWALSGELRQTIVGAGYPANYLKARAGVLTGELNSQLQYCTDSQADVDSVVSLGWRIMQPSQPVWLEVMLHYGHAISGPTVLGKGENPILSAVAAQTNLQLSLTQVADRNTPNARWLVKYAQGVMDSDALSYFVFGELYIPVGVQPGGKGIHLNRQWRFPAALQSALAAYACNFATPFWAPYAVDGQSRTLTLAGTTTITETLLGPPTSAAYAYTSTGLQGIQSFRGELSVTARGDDALLRWTVDFAGDNAQSLVSCVGFVAAAAEQMGAALQNYFQPRD